MLIRKLAPIAGMAGPSVFVGLVIIQYLIKDGFDILAWPISARAVGDLGWIQTANFVISATLLGIFGLGVRSFLGEGQVPVIASVLLTFAGFFMVWAAIFPLEGVGGTYDPEADPGLHAIAPPMVFPSAGIGVILASVALRRREGTRGLGTITLTGGILVMVCFGLIGGFARSPGMPLNGVFGLLQMGVVLGWMGSVFLIALRWRTQGIHVDA